jgi:C4-dicarboxylate transporter DctM subunit
MFETSGVVLLSLLILFALLATKTPIALALLASAAIGMLLLDGAFLAADALSRLPYESASRYTLIIVPLYLAMGVFIRFSGGAEEIFRLAAGSLKKIPGGLGIATITACAAFAAVSGSSIATVATVGRVSIQEMIKYGYARHVAAGIVGSAGTLGIMIPPSVALVLYGILTGESIGRLLIAGILPGIMTAIIYAAAITIRARINPSLFGQGAESNSADRSKARKLPILQMAAIFLVIIGGIQSGIFTVIESAGVACMLALVFFITNRARSGAFYTEFGSAMREVVNVNTMTFALLIGAGAFSYFLVSAGVPTAVTEWVLSLDVPPWVVVAVLLLAFVPLGMFLDGIAMLLIGVPLAYPVVDALGYDGIWFGILVVKMVELGLITPPFGMNAFVISGVARDISIPTAFRGLMWFVPLELFTITLIFLFPQIATFLPQLMRG